MNKIIFLFDCVIELIGIKTQRTVLKNGLIAEIESNNNLIKSANQFGYVENKGIQLSNIYLKKFIENIQIFSLKGKKYKKEAIEINKWIVQVNHLLLKGGMPSTRSGRTWGRVGLLKAISQNSVKLIAELGN